MQGLSESAQKAASLASSISPAPAITAGPQDATTFALIYGLPLQSFSHLASKIEQHKGEFETNAFLHQKQLARAGFTDINRPNVDTLYSEALLDLSSHDLIVTIPKVPSDRFYVFPIYDVYGNNIANLGTAGISNTPGRYLLTYRTADPGYTSGDDVNDNDDTYTGYIFLPTPYGIIDLRIQVNGSDDVDQVTPLQSQFTLKPIPTGVHLAPKLTKSLLGEGLSETDPTENLLQLTARFSQFNLPEVGFDISRVNDILQLAGLTRGSYTTPSKVDLTRARDDAKAAIESVRHSSKYFHDLGNNWSELLPKFSGDFKNDYLARAFVASLGYLQLKSEQALYPVYKVDRVLTSEKSYSLTFSGKPPVGGFWSVTVYDEGSLLVKNEWDVYSLGDRSGIKYPDGKFVYPKEGEEGGDGEFMILLQTLDEPPPEKYRSNWIPTPKRGDKFDFNLRWYGPKKELENYVYPRVKVSEPIKAD